ncbi:MAG: hypothetical protein JKY43_02315 [Phycisphaerales bacterium]|nr:hypothetical protein [Phycisphaerales bacterium]
MEHTDATFHVAPSLGHLKHMTDRVGLVQHARLGEPFYDEGYSIDDNARALTLMCDLSQEENGDHADLADLASRYLVYVTDAWNPASKRFRNFKSAELQWLEEQGSEDCHGRALHALGHAANCTAWNDIAADARSSFEEALASTASFTSPRAWAFTLFGIDEYLQSGEDQCCAAQYRSLLARRLLNLYQLIATDDWPWLEEVLTYCNAKLPHALLRSGYAMGRDDMIETALGMITWLAEIHTGDTRNFVPIGSNGFYPKNGHRAVFDQQPIEAHAIVASSLDAYRLTSDRFWFDEAIRAFQWFLGHNHLGIPVGNPETGACYDGLHQDRPNLNLGAESTLAYLLSCAEMRNHASACRAR